MIAALGVYDIAPLRGANDRFWALIRDTLGYGPHRLTRDRDLREIWDSPDLLLAQACGLAYRRGLHDRVQLVGTPDYGLPGCPPGHYRAVILVRADDDRKSLEQFAAGTMAFDDPLSQAGWAAPVAHLRMRGLAPARLLHMGSQAAAARAVAEGRADFTALDAVTWMLLHEHDPVAHRLREIDRTEPMPGLPLVTAPGRDATAIAAAVRRAIAQLTPEDRARLHLQALIPVPAGDYLSLPLPPEPDLAA